MDHVKWVLRSSVLAWFRAIECLSNAMEVHGKIRSFEDAISMLREAKTICQRAGCSGDMAHILDTLDSLRRVAARLWIASGLQGEEGAGYVSVEEALREAEMLEENARKAMRRLSCG